MTGVINPVFGQILSTENVEDAYVGIISLWADTYLSEVERQNGILVPTIGRPASFQQSYDTDNWPLEQMPGVVVMCPGSSGTMERTGSQEYGSWFSVGVAVIVSGQSQIEARKVGQRYQAAINALILQHNDLGGFARDTVLVSFMVDLQEVENRYIAVAISQFDTFVNGIVFASEGPLLPDPTRVTWDPNAAPGSPEGDYTGLPTVSDTEITLTET